MDEMMREEGSASAMSAGYGSSNNNGGDGGEESRSLRMQKLELALQKAIEKTATGCSLQKLLGCFPPELTAQHVELFEAAHSQAMRTFQENLQDELKEVCEKRELREKLQRLDRLYDSLQQAKNEKYKIAALPVTPTALNTRTAQHIKLETKEQLTAILQKLEEEQTTLRAEVTNLQRSRDRHYERGDQQIARASAVVKLCNEWKTSGAKRWLEEVQQEDINAAASGGGHPASHHLG
ncbi:hypothetical protein QOT17_011296 [Balamuthia mandrillaris]